MAEDGATGEKDAEEVETAADAGVNGTVAEAEVDETAAEAESDGSSIWSVRRIRPSMNRNVFGSTRCPFST